MPKLRIEVFENGAPSATITIPSWLMVAASKMLPRMAGKSLQDRIDLENRSRRIAFVDADAVVDDALEHRERADAHARMLLDAAHRGRR